MENPFKPTENYKKAVIVITGIFAFLAIAVMAGFDHYFKDPYLVASFGATAVLIYGAPKAGFSQPKNVFFGHLFSAIIGVCVAFAFDALGIYGDYVWIGAGIAVSVSIVVMMLTGTIHPPGGATALTCVISGYSAPIYIFRPVMLGIVIMMVLAYVANYLKSRCE